jgi:hypothetical protein
MDLMFPSWFAQLREDMARMRMESPAEFEALEDVDLPLLEVQVKGRMYRLSGKLTGLYGCQVVRSEEVVTLVYVPEKRRETVLWVYHLPTHRSANEMLVNIRMARMTWNGMKQATAGCVTRCHWCAVRDGRAQPARLQVPTSIERGFATWVLDQLELYPNPEDPDLKAAGVTTGPVMRGILVFVNCATRYCVLTPVPAFVAENVRWAIRELAGTFGRMDRIVADAASYFAKTSRQHDEELRRVLVRMELVAPTNHRAVGLVECRMGVAKALLANLLMGSRRWVKEVPELQLALNAKRCRITGYCAMELMFPMWRGGSAMDVAREERCMLAVGTDVWESELLGLDADQVSRMLEVATQRAARADGQEMSEWMKRVYAQLRNGSVVKYTMKVGDWVLADIRVDPEDKAIIVWTGPYQIKEYDEVRGRYTLGVHDQVMRVREIVRPGDQLKRWLGSDAAQWVADRVGAGPLRKNVGIAERVVDDKVFADSGNVVERMFRVRWSGFGSGDDAWLPEREVKGLVCFREYVSKKAREGEAWAKDVHEPRSARTGKKVRVVREERMNATVATPEVIESVGGSIRRAVGVPAIETAETGVIPVGVDEAAATVTCEMKTSEGKTEVMDVVRDVHEGYMTAKKKAQLQKRIQNQGRVLDHSGEVWPGGRIVTAELLTEIVAQGAVEFSGEGDGTCAECMKKGTLLQCSYCTRAYHPKCAAVTVYPTESEPWACVVCSHRFWPVRLATGVVEVGVAPPK